MTCRPLFFLLIASLVGCTAAVKDPAAEGAVELAAGSDMSADGFGPFQGGLGLCDVEESGLSERLPYHFWSFETEGCGDALIDLASRDGDDTFLLLYRQTRAGWLRIARNDDCRSGTLSSCLEDELEAGRYLVAASTYDYMRYGIPTAASYHLRIVCRDEGACSEPTVEPRACGSRGLAACDEGEFCDFPIDAICGATDRGGVCRPTPEACAEVWLPVCGCDGRTYSSACHAAQHATSVATEGACARPANGEGDTCGGIAGFRCEEGLICDRSGFETCGADYSGICTRPTAAACPEVVDPVCGCNGETYENDCERRAAGEPKSHDGPCD